MILIKKQYRKDQWSDRIRSRLEVLGSDMRQRTGRATDKIEELNYTYIKS